MNDEPSRNGFLAKLATNYERTSFAQFVRAIEPLGILFAAFGVVFAAGGLVFAALAVQLAVEEIKESRELRELTLQEFEANRTLREATLREFEADRELRAETLREFEADRGLRAATLREFEADRELRAETLNEFRNSGALREATLFAMLMERFAKARAEEEKNERSATRSVDSRGEYKFRRCNSRGQQLNAEVGQIEILEKMNEMGIDLEGIKANRVNFKTLLDRERDPASSGIKLGGAKLVDADFRESNLENADFRGAKLNFARFARSCLKRAQFTGADLPKADFRRADARDADFSNADLSNAVLGRADLSGANFAGTDLTNADLTSADLRSVRNLTQRQLDRACANPRREPPRLSRNRNLTWKVRDCP